MPSTCSSADLHARAAAPVTTRAQGVTQRRDRVRRSPHSGQIGHSTHGSDDAGGLVDPQQDVAAGLNVRGWRTALRRGALALGALLAASAPVQARDYSSIGSCGPYPRLAITSPAGTCVALVADEAHGLRFPRRVLEVSPGRLWVLDMGSWLPGKGQLIELRLPPDAALPANASTTAKRVEAKVLLDRLDRPSGLVRGRDGRIYVGEAGRIWRTAVPALGQPPVPEVLLDPLPSDGAHPLKELAVAPDGQLYVNLGSSTDACRGDDQKLPMPCPDRRAVGGKPRAAVWRLTLAEGKTGPAAVQRFEPFAQGLRNSMALAVLPDGPAAGSVWQGENGIDYTDANHPPEELNRLQEGGDYGWPYCIGNRQPARGYEQRVDCSTTQAPHLLWPAHVAPVQLLATPANSPFQGQLLAAWHGPGAGGQRVVGLARDARGLPSGAPIDWLSGWSARKNPDGKSLRPRGRPTGLALDQAGRLLVVEDFNRSLLMLMREDGTLKK
ncbi:hypothetical protein CCO03_18380 [Comamonas serinivorans]|uniref:Glucose/Sorbosone dehydrogenase domain-containing protein n=1 Tax=Comamonas serinivorans TaxID=1082851 RepID=A0A1Y0ERS1_9BURK|nr:PQQ-dependent sugar dehydrogenase [Comamonas serinivorans]ARU06365.1 hypothetical protein CCO03_18380 [Comamonas serinivorans]